MGAFSSRSSWPYGTRSTCSKCERLVKDRPRGGDASRPSIGREREGKSCAPIARAAISRGARPSCRRRSRSRAASGARWVATRACRSASEPSPAWRASPARTAPERRPPGTGADVRPWGAAETYAAWARRTPCSRRARGPRSSERSGRRRTRRLRGGRSRFGQRAFGAFRWASRIAVNRQFSIIRVRIDRGREGGEAGGRTRAFARCERQDAGGDMRSRLVGGVHAAGDSHLASRGEPRADRSARQIVLSAWKSLVEIFLDSERGASCPRREPRNPKAGVHTHSRRDVRACGRVTPRGGLVSRPTSSFERDETSGRCARAGPLRTRACVSPSASGECRSGNRHAKLDRRPVSLRRVAAWSPRYPRRYGRQESLRLGGSHGRGARSDRSERRDGPRDDR